MKFQILTLQGKTSELECEQHTTIRDIRIMLAEQFRAPWHHLEIYVVNKADNCKLTTIYADDNADMSIEQFARDHAGINCKSDNLSFMVIKNPNVTLFRPTKKYKKNKLSFKERLIKIEYPLDQIPREFIDSFTAQLMEDPVITVSQKCIDAKTADNLLQYDAAMAILFEVLHPNLQLKAKLEYFVSELEKLHQCGQLITVTQSSKFLQECDKNIRRIQMSGRKFGAKETNIGLDDYDSPHAVRTDVENELIIDDNSLSLSFIGRLDKLEVAKLLILTTIVNTVYSDIKRRGYSNLLNVFNETKDIYHVDVMSEINITMDSLMKLHRSRWFRENLLGRLLSKLIMPTSARHLDKLGFFKWCETQTENPGIQPGNFI